MKELELKYGCNPNQKPSKIYMEDGSELPIKVLSGKPGYINFLDDFPQLLHLNMFPRQVLPLVFRSQRRLQKSTG